MTFVQPVESCRLLSGPDSKISPLPVIHMRFPVTQRKHQRICIDILLCKAAKTGISSAGRPRHEELSPPLRGAPRKPDLPLSMAVLSAQPPVRVTIPKPMGPGHDLSPSVEVAGRCPGRSTIVRTLPLNLENGGAEGVEPLTSALRRLCSICNSLF